MTAAVFDRRDETGYTGAMLLALAVHLALVAVLVFGVRWQSRAPEAVVVELWEAPPAPPARDIEPPKPVPELKPEPRIESPEIVLKEPPKPKALPPKPDPMQKLLREQLAREQATITVQRREAELREMLARESASARAKAIATWVDKIRAKIRSNIVLPPDLKGNPEAIFDVVQLPTGEVLSVKLRKSSGHRGYDDAVERAIHKSSPLPKPDQPGLFERALELKFRPLD